MSGASGSDQPKLGPVYADLAADWVLAMGTLPPSPEPLLDWARQPVDTYLEAETAYLERRGPDPLQRPARERGPRSTPVVRLTNGYFATARRHAPVGTRASAHLARCLASLQEHPIEVDWDDIERLRFFPRPVAGTSPALAIVVEAEPEHMVVLFVELL